jgi:type IV pilus assembly protein PilE
MGAATGLQSRAFTLIDMLVALSVVAILCAIAWPGYRQVMHRTQRIEARLALMKLQYLQERHFADHHVYARELRADGGGGSLPIAPNSENGTYDLSMQLATDGQAYVAIALASPTGRQARDTQCQRLSIDTVGARRSAAANGPWREEPGAGCWS